MVMGDLDFYLDFDLDLDFDLLLDFYLGGLFIYLPDRTNDLGESFFLCSLYFSLDLDFDSLLFSRLL